MLLISDGQQVTHEALRGSVWWERTMESDTELHQMLLYGSPGPPKTFASKILPLTTTYFLALGFDGKSSGAAGRP